jgi:hypothetical protein
MLTMPSMLFALAGTGLWIAVLLVLSPHPRSRGAAYLCLYGALTAALTALFYTPTVIVSGADAVLNNRFVAPQPWSEFASMLAPHVWETASHFARDVPSVALIACAALVLAGLVAALVTRNWAAFTLLPALIAGAALTLALKHRIPYPRTWIYLLPCLLIIADLGLSCLLQRMAAVYRALPPLLLLALSVSASRQIVSNDLLAHYPDVGAFPEASAIVQRLKSLVHRGEAVHVRSPGNFPVRFYLWYYGVPEHQNKPRRPRQEFIVVRKGVDPTPDGDPQLAFELDTVQVYQRIKRSK